ncbi:indole-3-glycerol phosphate synthase TrpC [Priestia taiwanensis]|uniref:Indole-3-glycerol phosphate synthase n=1 Tax=Priestia taiwanensis TaxID=1347902 RepID=A0A917AXE1_9BACI|nr:indole-3-glycerol phosphate synthase TrpC [Priestia taiwanensis]MBM7363355.1 indole-3-glycerol phosphate synthase [Priestia taiwanensis]GGE77833.1 indole-3-glycerol phosphate synthase [Priestia taiwanensis]
MLTKILTQKQREIEEMKRQKHSFLEKIRNHSSLAIISEIKRASPSKGDINIGINIIEQAKQYEAYGASAISVLTDEVFFKGSYEDLRQVRECVDVPILCKEFIVDEIQIYKAKSVGADIILLIVAALTKERLQQLYKCAVSLGLEVLVEVHDEEELDIALSIRPDLIGINNRNLKTFEVSLETTERLAEKAKAHGVFVISESGIRTKEDVLRLHKARVDGMLIGETFMRAENVEEMFNELQVQR